MTSRSFFDEAQRVSTQLNIPLRACYRARGTSKRYWQTEIAKLNRVRLIARRTLRKRASTTHHVQVNVDIYDVRLNRDSINIPDTTNKPIVTVRGAVTRAKVRHALASYIQTLNYDNVRIVHAGFEPALDYSPTGIYLLTYFI